MLVAMAVTMPAKGPPTAEISTVPGVSRYNGIRDLTIRKARSTFMAMPDAMNDILRMLFFLTVCGVFFTVMPHGILFHL
jgi:hypothetical protein